MLKVIFYLYTSKIVKEKSAYILYAKKPSQSQATKKKPLAFPVVFLEWLSVALRYFSFPCKPNVLNFWGRDEQDSIFFLVGFMEMEIWNIIFFGSALCTIY